MLEINFGPFPELKTGRLVLRQMLETDAGALFRLRSDPRVMRYFGRHPMQSIDEAILFIEQVQAMFRNNEGIQWVISFPDNPLLIGTITIWKIDKTNHRGEIGYLLDPDHQGKGLMTEALSALLHYTFNTLQLHSVEANVNPENANSIRLLERAGFVREAYFRENFYFDGNFEDSAIYSLLTPVGRISGIENNP